MVGSQYNRKTIWKNGAMLHYIKVLLWTPAECMHRGAIKRRNKENIDVLLLFSNSAASQRCRKFGNSNFIFEMPFKYSNSGGWSRNQTACQHSLWAHSVASTLLTIPSIQIGWRKFKCCPCSSLFFVSSVTGAHAGVAICSDGISNWKLEMEHRWWISYLITNGDV